MFSLYVTLSTDTIYGKHFNSFWIGDASGSVFNENICLEGVLFSLGRVELLYSHSDAHQQVERLVDYQSNQNQIKYEQYYMSN